jgi:hypothetical protein
VHVACRSRAAPSSGGSARGERHAPGPCGACARRDTRSSTSAGGYAARGHMSGNDSAASLAAYLTWGGKTAWRGICASPAFTMADHPPGPGPVPARLRASCRRAPA